MFDKGELDCNTEWWSRSWGYGCRTFGKFKTGDVIHVFLELKVKDTFKTKNETLLSKELGKQYRVCKGHVKLSLCHYIAPCKIVILYTYPCTNHKFPNVMLLIRDLLSTRAYL